MLSPSDTILIFVVALLLFGPEHLPKIARQLGDAMRHGQNTTNSFMAEMDRAAAAADHPPQPPPPWSQPPDESRERSIEESIAVELPGAPLHAQDAPMLGDDAPELPPLEPKPENTD